MLVTSFVFVLIDGLLAAETIVDIKIFIIAPLNQIYGITIKRVSAQKVVTHQHVALSEWLYIQPTAPSCSRFLSSDTVS